MTDAREESVQQMLKEAKRLHGLGFAILWLKPRSKKPTESKWTTGGRKSWAELERTYRAGMNVGVRLGKNSKLTDGFYLSVVDCDMKSTELKHLKEMEAKLRELLPKTETSVVLSGRGNGSRHLYTKTKTPLSPLLFARSAEKVSIKLAGRAVTRAAWEISILGEGQQVVLPPSIHPDTGKKYSWRKQPVSSPKAISVFSIPPHLAKTAESRATTPSDGSQVPPKEPFTPVKVDLLFGEKVVPESLSRLILEGEGCTDRSASLYVVAKELNRLGFSKNEILSVLSDRSTYLGKTGYDRGHCDTGNRSTVVRWLERYTVGAAEKAIKDEYADSTAGLTALTEEEAKAEVEKAFGPLREEAEGWESKLDRTEGGRPRPSLKNTLLVLRNAAPLKFLIRNRFSHYDIYNLDTPWGGLKGAAIRDTDINLFREWCEEHYRFDPSGQVGPAFDVVAENNSFHPVQEYLNRLPSWDGVSRLDIWLKSHLGAKGPDDYLAQVFRKWMVAAVARIFEPGVQFDWMLIFEGKQGTGKSTFFRNLAGGEFFSDWLDDMKGKDAAQGLRGVWIHEMGELASLRKTEVETVKAFLSRRVDRYRPTHGKLEVMAPRQCVFAGSTNRTEYLRDDTGNRRFVIVQVGDEFNFKANADNRDQLWAEAVLLYKRGEILELEGKAKEHASLLQHQRTVQTDMDIMQEILSAWREEREKSKEPSPLKFDRFRLEEIFDTVFPKWKYDARNTQFAARALKNLGAKTWASNGTRYWTWRS